MGPRLIERGNRRLGILIDGELDASMGPRLIERGNGALPKIPVSVRTASMGPRLIERGNTAKSAKLVAAISRFNGAALD